MQLLFQLFFVELSMKLLFRKAVVARPSAWTKLTSIAKTALKLTNKNIFPGTYTLEERKLKMYIHRRECIKLQFQALLHIYGE